MLTAILVLAAVVCGSVACKREIAEPAASPESKYSLSATAININAASPAELEKIPFIGEKLALQIVEHREQYGPFRRSEDLLLIPGISDSRFRKIRDLVRVD
ncbi:MAG: helix-hairpin-helix domain-containing protein [Pyrinomonadaceae bacterium]